MVQVLLAFRFSKQSSMTPRVGSSSNKAVHVAIRPRARRLTFSWVVCHSAKEVISMGKFLRTREAYPICNDFFETLRESLGSYLAIHLDTDVHLERFCQG